MLSSYFSDPKVLSCFFLFINKIFDTLIMVVLYPSFLPFLWIQDGSSYSFGGLIIWLRSMIYAGVEQDYNYITMLELLILMSSNKFFGYYNWWTRSSETDIVAKSIIMFDLSDFFNLAKNTIDNLKFDQIIHRGMTSFFFFFPNLTLERKAFQDFSTL